MEGLGVEAPAKLGDFAGLLFYFAPLMGRTSADIQILWYQYGSTDINSIGL